MQRLCALSFGDKLVGYTPALRLQEQLSDLVRTGALPSLVLCLQHKHVFTLGKRGRDEDLLVGRSELNQSGIDVQRTNRGGEVTYHGPGQLVLYPIVNLRKFQLGARRYVETLEDTVVNTLARYNIQGRGRVKGATGVWVEDRKVAAIGVKISKGVSTHGLALNVDPNLALYSKIVPCGLRDKQVTSVKRELNLLFESSSSNEEQKEEEKKKKEEEQKEDWIRSNQNSHPSLSEVQGELLSHLRSLLGTGPTASNSWTQKEIETIRSSTDYPWEDDSAFSTTVKHS